MAPPSRLIGLAILTLAVAGCTAAPPPPAPTGTPSRSTSSSPVAAPPGTAAEALARHPRVRAADDVDPDAAERLWLHRGENTIEDGGSYRLRGWVSGRIVVDAGDEPVVLVLDDLTLRSREDPAIEVRSAAEVVIVAAQASTNSIEVDSDSPGIRSAAPLTLAGTGSLDVDTGGDGIRVGAGLVVDEGSLRLNAGGDGIRASGHLVVNAGTLTVAADGTGLRSDGDDAGTGYVAVRDPFLTINAGADGIRAASDIIVFGGGLDVRTAGGHESAVGEDDPATALRAGRHLVADDGSFLLDAAGDGVNAADAVVVNGGDWEIAAGDDAVHADLRLRIAGGTIAVTSATEGIEAESVTIAGGTIAVAATDDALNASEADEPAATPSITISGGTLRLDSTAGDGLDANGDVTMTGGDLTIAGAPVDNESAIDYDDSFLISGGRIAAGGGAGMAQPPSGTSPQRSLWFDVEGHDGTVVAFRGPDGAVAGSFTGTRDFGTVVVSGPEIAAGRTYAVMLDGEQVGTTTTDDADNAPRRFPRRR